MDSVCDLAGCGRAQLEGVHGSPGRWEVRGVIICIFTVGWIHSVTWQAFEGHMFKETVAHGSPVRWEVTGLNMGIFTGGTDYS